MYVSHAGTTRAALLAVSLSIGCAVALRAGPPLETDDPDTPGPGRWEINLATELERRADIWAWTPVLDINYGVGERVQLKIRPSYVILDEPHVDARSGPGNVQFGLKWRFLDETRHGFSISIYPQIDLNPPGTSDRRGLVDDGADCILPVELARTLGHTRLYGEAAYVWREKRRDGWFVGLAFEHPLEAALLWTGEVRAESDGSLGDSELLFNLGAKARLAEHVTLLVSAGRTLREVPGKSAAVFSYLGLQFTF
jgi:hypothetical protein